MNAHFPTIGIVTKSGDPRTQAVLERLVRLLKRRDHRWMLSTPGLAEHDHHAVPCTGMEAFGSGCDLCIVIGGDGTMLNAARGLAEQDIPMIGVNLGRLGFLADIDLATLESTLSAMLDGHYVEDSRFLLTTNTCHPQGKPDLALNDVAIHKWNSARIIELETWIDGRFLHRQSADGMIVATPTGSTAYALSGGGPLLEPSLDALVLVSICPHTLGNRPLVVNGHCEITIRFLSDPGHIRITCDGQESRPLPDSGILRIRKAPHPIRLLHPGDHDHFEILRAKLGWAGQPLGEITPC